MSTSFQIILHCATTDKCVCEYYLIYQCFFCLWTLRSELQMFLPMANHLNPQHLIYVVVYEFSSLVSSLCFWLDWSLAIFSYFNAEFNLLVATSFQFGSFQKRMIAHSFVLTILFLHILTETKTILLCECVGFFPPQYEVESSQNLC